MTGCYHDLNRKPASTPLPPYDQSLAQRVFPDALFGTPFDPILL